jgi:hypothetical protein
MRFLVPQFIDVEDKLLGPLTLKQGIYLLGGVGISFAIFIKFGFVTALFVGGPILLFSFALAFIKIHGRPFIFILASAFFFVTNDKLYLWKKAPKKKKLASKKTMEEKHDGIHPSTVTMNQSKLKKLAWSLDTNSAVDNKKET